MRLYIGGTGQGKLGYVIKHEGIKEFFDGGKEDIKNIGKYKGINKFNLLIKRLLNTDTDIYLFIQSLNMEVVICDEVGNGIVPVEHSEELYRETVGRVCCMLAEKSERVVRIFCGMGQVIK